eukprot:PhM_4_TR5924/c2_g1_i2/m.71538
MMLSMPSRTRFLRVMNARMRWYVTFRCTVRLRSMARRIWGLVRTNFLCCLKSSHSRHRRSSAWRSSSSTTARLCLVTDSPSSTTEVWCDTQSTVRTLPDSASQRTCSISFICSSSSMVRVLSSLPTRSIVSASSCCIRAAPAAACWAMRASSSTARAFSSAALRSASATRASSASLAAFPSATRAASAAAAASSASFFAAASAATRCSSATRASSASLAAFSSAALRSSSAMRASSASFAALASASASFRSASSATRACLSASSSAALRPSSATRASSASLAALAAASLRSRSASSASFFSLAALSSAAFRAASASRASSASFSAAALARCCSSSASRASRSSFSALASASACSCLARSASSVFPSAARWCCCFSWSSTAFNSVRASARNKPKRPSATTAQRSAACSQPTRLRALLSRCSDDLVSCAARCLWISSAVGTRAVGICSVTVTYSSKAAKVSCSSHSMSCRAKHSDRARPMTFSSSSLAPSASLPGTACGPLGGLLVPSMSSMRSSSRSSRCRCFKLHEDSRSAFDGLGNISRAKYVVSDSSIVRRRSSSSCCSCFITSVLRRRSIVLAVRESDDMLMLGNDGVDGDVLLRAGADPGGVLCATAGSFVVP